MSSRARSARGAIVLTVWLVLTAPAAAQAGTFFVSKTGSGGACTEALPCDTISTALAASRAAAGTGDEIRVGPGLYTERVLINDEKDAGLTLHGAGRGADETATPSGATTIRAPVDNKNNVIEVSKAAGVTVEQLRVEVPSGFVNTAGVQLEAPETTIREAHIQSAGAGNTEAVWVDTPATDASILDSRIHQIGEYRGIAIFGPRATIADSDVKVSGQQAVDVEEAASTGARILRSRIEAGEGLVMTLRDVPDMVIDSTLIVGGERGISIFAGLAPVSLVTLSNDTIDVDAPKSGASGTAVEARAEAGKTASVSLVNSIALEAQRVEGEGASVTCKRSIVQAQAETSPEGTVSCGSVGGNLSALPSSVFVSGSDWHLLPGSPAVDSGSEGDSLSATDLDGAPRVVDGDGDGVATIDRGAYELPTPVPGAGATPSNAFKFRKLKRNKKAGTAKLQVEVPGPGRLVLSGKKVKKFTRDAKGAGTFALKVIPKAKLARSLRSKGTARTSVRVTFTPTGGTANTRSKALKLIQRQRR